METKFHEYPNAILLNSNSSVEILNPRNQKVWTISWVHEQHVLCSYEITHPNLVANYRKNASILDRDCFLIVNPYLNMHEMLLNVSVGESSGDVSIKLLKKSFLGGLDFRINSEIVYYGSCSPYYGYKGIVEDSAGSRFVDGTTEKNYPVFVKY